MTPDISAVIERTIHLQQQTNRWQLFTLILLFVSNGLIILSVILIRKATRTNKEWSRMNKEWADRLSAASAIEARRAETQGGSVVDESAVANGETPTTPRP